MWGRDGAVDGKTTDKNAGAGGGGWEMHPRETEAHTANCLACPHSRTWTQADLASAIGHPL